MSLDCSWVHRQNGIAAARRLEEMQDCADTAWNQAQNFEAEPGKKPMRQKHSGNRNGGPAKFGSGCQDSFHGCIPEGSYGGTMGEVPEKFHRRFVVYNDIDTASVV